MHLDHWGKGFALDAGLAAVRDLFEHAALERVYAGSIPNEKGHRTLAKARGCAG